MKLFDPQKACARIRAHGVREQKSVDISTALIATASKYHGATVPEIALAALTVLSDMMTREGGEVVAAAMLDAFSDE